MVYGRIVVKSVVSDYNQPQSRISGSIYLLMHYTTKYKNLQVHTIFVIKSLIVLVINSLL